MKDPQVSIIILNWNGLQDTVECLESLKKITYKNYEVILVDNASSGNDVQVLKKKFGKYIKIIQNDKNYGFAEGNNIAIRKVMKEGKSKYVLLLNNDIVVDPNFLDELVKTGESDPKIGIVGPIIYNYYTKEVDFAGGRISLWNGATKHMHKPGKETDFITGCCILIPLKVLNDVGLFDERYFAYYEDVDLSLRINKKYDLKICESAKIWHKISKSTKINKYSIYYSTRSRIFFVKRYNDSISCYLFIMWFITYRHFTKFINFILFKGDIDSMILFYRGFLDGIRGKGPVNRIV